VQPLPEQTRKKQRRSPRFSSPLDQLATVELQLMLQFLDTTSKLKAARCSRHLLQAADHPFAWQGPPVAVSSRGRQKLGSLIRQSLLRHASIALTLDSRLTAAEVAAIPRLRELDTFHCDSCDLPPMLLSLPSLQGLQTLRASFGMPLRALLPSLPALSKLECWVTVGSSDWSWLAAVPALTDLSLACSMGVPLPLRDAIGECAQLQSLQLRSPTFPAGAFGRLCSTPALRQLRQLDLVNLGAHGVRFTDDEYRAAFSCLAQLESLRLMSVNGVDRLLPHLVHAPALRRLIIPCDAQNPEVADSLGSTHPSRNELHSLLTAAPLLQVRLAAVASLEEWCEQFWYEESSASQREQIDQQWRDLMRMGAEMERVTIVEADE
jgi:hypothetical protein